MKTTCLTLSLGGSFVLALVADAAFLQPTSLSVAAPPPITLFRSDQPNPAAARWQAGKRNGYRTDWMRTERLTNTVTGFVREVRHSFVALASGLNRKDATGQYQPADPSFQITDRGAEATSTVHRVLLAPDINSWGAIRIEKGGVTLQLHPLCIGYYDPTDGRSLALADLTNAVGWLVASNTVVYSNCFQGDVRASIRIRNSISGAAQELLIHERPSLTPAELGFSDRTRLELFSEIVGDTPTPAIERHVICADTATTNQQQMVEPDFSDATLDFGTLKMSAGRAFLTGTNAARGASHRPVPVGKRFEVIGGRRVLIEAAEWYSASRILLK